MAKALKEAGIPFEFHIFPEAAHGLSLSNETWEKGEIGEPYTMDQTFRVIEEIKKGTISVSEEVKKKHAFVLPERTGKG